MQNEIERYRERNTRLMANLRHISIEYVLYLKLCACSSQPQYTYVSAALILLAFFLNDSSRSLSFFSFVFFSHSEPPSPVFFHSAVFPAVLFTRHGLLSSVVEVIGSSVFCVCVCDFNFICHL